MNGVFGIFVAIWATFFVESWKRKQRTIQYIWGCNDKSFSPIDERTQFKYLQVFNENTDQLEKANLKVSKSTRRLQRLAAYFFLAIVMFAMGFYQNIVISTKGEIDEAGDIVVPPTDQDKRNGSLYSFIYSIVVIVFGTAYKQLAYKQTDDENYQYQKEHDDALINRLFLFNGLNYYFPLLYVAFDERNPRNYDDLFQLLLAQLAYKQTGLNVMEYIKPIITTKKKLTDLYQDYKNQLNKYLPES